MVAASVDFFLVWGEGEEEGCLWGKAGGIVVGGERKEKGYLSFLLFFLHRHLFLRGCVLLAISQETSHSPARGGGRGGDWIRRVKTTRKRMEGKGSGAEAAKLHFLYLASKKNQAQ